MAQRNSEYARIAGDTYITPRWVWEALYSVEPWAVGAFDCAPVNTDYDFLKDWELSGNVATNPPYGRRLAERFVRHALDLPAKINLAFLLPHTWDCAKNRIGLFSDSRLACKYVLTRRILWDNLEHTSSPSTNHAWFVWHSGPRQTQWPVLRWLSGEEPMKHQRKRANGTIRTRRARARPLPRGESTSPP